MARSAWRIADGDMPPKADRFLRPKDVEAVTDYVMAELKGRGSPSFEECQAFFGTETRACNSLRQPGAGKGAAIAPSGH